MDAKSPVEKQFLSYTQAGQYCGVSRWTLHRAVKAGNLKICAAGGVKRFERSDLDRWLRGEK